MQGIAWDLNPSQFRFWLHLCFHFLAKKKVNDLSIKLFVQSSRAGRTWRVFMWAYNFTLNKSFLSSNSMIHKQCECD